MPSGKEHPVGKKSTTIQAGPKASQGECPGRWAGPVPDHDVGVAALAEFFDKLDVVAVFDAGIGSIKKRARGASAGQLLVRMAQSQLLAGEALVAMGSATP